mmetsp:Transcript_5968/g.8694  ORF Transcript_5968/g.8694 Transcript_5968/m.8694 type:complete len:87 (-) Transcript_5968:2851-3111(-)
MTKGEEEGISSSEHNKDDDDSTSPLELYKTWMVQRREMKVQLEKIDNNDDSALERGDDVDVESLSLPSVFDYTMKKRRRRKKKKQQ